MAQCREVFTPRRWQLVESLKAAGPLTIHALAKRLGSHYRSVHADVTTLIEWLAIEEDGAGRVFVPWDEIALRWRLSSAARFARHG